MVKKIKILQNHTQPENQFTELQRSTLEWEWKYLNDAKCRAPRKSCRITDNKDNISSAKSNNHYATRLDKRSINGCKTITKKHTIRLKIKKQQQKISQRVPNINPMTKPKVTKAPCNYRMGCVPQGNRWLPLKTAWGEQSLSFSFFGIALYGVGWGSKQGVGDENGKEITTCQEPSKCACTQKPKVIMARQTLGKGSTLAEDFTVLMSVLGFMSG